MTGDQGEAPDTVPKAPDPPRHIRADGQDRASRDRVEKHSKGTLAPAVEDGAGGVCGAVGGDRGVRCRAGRRDDWCVQLGQDRVQVVDRLPQAFDRRRRARSRVAQDEPGLHDSVPYAALEPEGRV